MGNKVLICEDEKEARELLSVILKKNNLEIYTAVDGKEAIEKTEEISPDLIVLDIRMTKIDGLEVAKRIRRFNTTVKIIILSGFASPELTKEAAKYDICDYIVKTSSVKDILKVVQNAIKE